VVFSKEVTKKLDENFSAIDESLAQMDLELLSGLLKRRSAYVEELIQILQAERISREAGQAAMERLREQNFYIQARIMVRMDRASKELKKLYDLSRRCHTY
jgi:uncharacterized protein YPO0396